MARAILGGAGDEEEAAYQAVDGQVQYFNASISYPSTYDPTAVVLYPEATKYISRTGPIVENAEEVYCAVIRLVTSVSVPTCILQMAPDAFGPNGDGVTTIYTATLSYYDGTTTTNSVPVPLLLPYYGKDIQHPNSQSEAVDQFYSSIWTNDRVAEVINLTIQQAWLSLKALAPSMPTTSDYIAPYLSYTEQGLFQYTAPMSTYQERGPTYPTPSTTTYDLQFVSQYGLSLGNQFTGSLVHTIEATTNHFQLTFSNITLTSGHFANTYVFFKNVTSPEFSKGFTIVQPGVSYANGDIVRLIPPLGFDPTAPEYNATYTITATAGAVTNLTPQNVGSYFYATEPAPNTTVQFTTVSGSGSGLEVSFAQWYKIITPFLPPLQSFPGVDTGCQCACSNVPAVVDVYLAGPGYQWGAFDYHCTFLTACNNGATLSFTPAGISWDSGPIAPTDPLDPPLQLWFNEASFPFVKGFDYYQANAQGSIPSTVGKDFRVQFINNGVNWFPRPTAGPFPFAPSDPTTVSLVIPQNFATVLPSVDNIQLLCDLPSLAEFVQTPGNNEVAKILTDFKIDVSQVGTTATLFYNASLGDARWIKLTGKQPISALTLRLSCVDWMGYRHPLIFYGSAEQFDIKLAFATKNLVQHF